MEIKISPYEYVSGGRWWECGISEREMLEIWHYVIRQQLFIKITSDFRYDKRVLEVSRFGSNIKTHWQSTGAINRNRTRIRKSRYNSVITLHSKAYRRKQSDVLYETSLPLSRRARIVIHCRCTSAIQSSTHSSQNNRRVRRRSIGANDNECYIDLGDDVS